MPMVIPDQKVIITYCADEGSGLLLTKSFSRQAPDNQEILKGGVARENCQSFLKHLHASKNHLNTTIPSTVKQTGLAENTDSWTPP